MVVMRMMKTGKFFVRNRVTIENHRVIGLKDQIADTTKYSQTLFC